METKWTKWYAMTSHVIAYRSTELLFRTQTFNFNCFFLMILIAYLRKYAAYLGCWTTYRCPQVLDTMVHQHSTSNVGGDTNLDYSESLCCVKNGVVRFKFTK